MQNYKQILEAINKGILLALDDFDDEEQVLHVKSRLINHRDYTKEYLDLMKEFVDLGLPSGTLWCKYNLGSSNLSICATGDYYAWGELETKDEYTWDNHPYNKGCFPRQLPLKYDVATLTLGDYYSIPTKELCEELIKYTECKWVNYYKGQICGCLFIGKNGNQLFIPAAGEYTWDYIDEANSTGTIWTSNTDNDLGYAWSLTFNDNDKCAYMCTNPSLFGMSIRPVLNLRYYEKTHHILA